MRRGDFNLKAMANMKPMVEGQTQKRKEKNTFFELFITIRDTTMLFQWVEA